MSLFRLRKKQSGTISNDKLLLKKDSPFLMQEDYKTLRTNVNFSLPGNECKCIAFTSGNPSEGKSTNAVNLAISFGQIGKRVLLIDCDMRLPTVASKLDIMGQPGLSNVLIAESSKKEAIQTLPELAIDVLPAGTVPPDPTGLFESKQMSDLIAELRSEYDYIFFDLPPVLTVSDSIIVSKHIDGFLLVVKHEQSEYREVQEAIRQLRFVDAKILGLVYVNLNTSGQKYYSKHYYSYGNGK